MTRERIYGSDTPFCEWMRNCKDLPSYSQTCGFVALDNDLTIHRYLTEVDGQGTREIQALMHVEIKTRNGEPHPSQHDTLFKIHKSCCGFKGINNQMVVHYGVSILSLSGLTPDDSDSIRWGRFKGVLLSYKTISRKQLIQLLRFEIHPDNLSRRPFRRHHKTSRVCAIVKTPLGFETEHVLTVRS